MLPIKWGVAWIVNLRRDWTNNAELEQPVHYDQRKSMTAHHGSPLRTSPTMRSRYLKRSTAPCLSCAPAQSISNPPTLLETKILIFSFYFQVLWDSVLTSRRQWGLVGGDTSQPALSLTVQQTRPWVYMSSGLSLSTTPFTKFWLC